MSVFMYVDLYKNMDRFVIIFLKWIKTLLNWKYPSRDEIEKGLGFLTKRQVSNIFVIVLNFLLLNIGFNIIINTIFIISLHIVMIIYKSEAFLQLILVYPFEKLSYWFQTRNDGCCYILIQLFNKGNNFKLPKAESCF